MDAMQHDTTTPIGVEGTSNLRDLGGLPARGGRVRGRALYRSDALSRLTDEGRRAFTGLGVARVVDLRDQAELDRQPSVLEGVTVEVRHVPVFAAADPLALFRPADGREPGVATLYETMLDTCGERLAGAVEAVAATPAGGALVHCTAGKDRTGVVVALVLELLGVPEDRIVADYAASERNLAGPWADRMLAGAGAMARERGFELTPGLREIVVGSPAAAMRVTLERIRSAYGGAEAYLVDNGLDREAVSELRARFVAADGAH